jgi:nitroreductase
MTLKKRAIGACESLRGYIVRFAEPAKGSENMARRSATVPDNVNGMWCRTLLALLAIAGLAAGADAIQLPQPDMDGGRPLMQALKHRQTTREFAAKPLSQKNLSNLLWAAFGVNRPESGGRTAPSAHGHMEIDLYVFTGDAAYLYLPGKHALHPVLEGDHRKGTGSFPAAPVTIVYVADHSRSTKVALWEKVTYAYIDTGFIGQNVYLYAASEGLACVIHASTPKGALAETLGLRRDQQIIIAQSVGHRAE